MNIAVLDEVTAALLNPKALSLMFEESPTMSMPQLRATLENVALSSIMKLDACSMDKLFDLMTMMVKYQLTAATGPREIILIILNHIDGMRDMVSDVNAQKCVTLVHEMVVDVSHSMHVICRSTESDLRSIHREMSLSIHLPTVLQLPDLRRDLASATGLPERTRVAQRARFDPPATGSAKRGRQLQRNVAEVR